MKKAFKALIVSLLGWQVRRLRRKHNFTVIAVVGSIGKTSTKLAVAHVLGRHFRVRFQEGNYNDLVSVPLVFFGKPMPALLNPFGWAKLLLHNEFQLKRPYPYDVVIVELGTDGPGQLIRFKKYLNIDLLIVTAIAEEHMEFFDNLDAVAREELSPQTFSRTVLINTDLCSDTYSSLFKPGGFTYGIRTKADYQINITRFNGEAFDFQFLSQGKLQFTSVYQGVSEVELYSVCAAASAAEQMHMPIEKVQAAVQKLTAFSGRMQRLAGVKGSLIIDDTYNASPVATKAALDTLYSLNASQKIALLGNMNELGSRSPGAHTEVGEYCNPRELDLVIAIGKDANKYLAPAAEKRGCRVKTFNDPYTAGTFIRDTIKTGAVVLAKGSQNGVFAEEAVKLLLVNSEDAKLLVRQSPEWLKKKQQAFQAPESKR